MTATPDPRFAFDLRFDDYRRLSHARARLGPLGRFGRFGRWVSFLGFFLATLGGLAWYDSVPLWVFGEWDVLRWILLVPLLMLLTDVVIEHGVYRWYFNRLAGAGKAVTLTLTPEGLDWMLDTSHGTNAWGSFVARVVTPDHLFLFISKLEAFTLP